MHAAQAARNLLEHLAHVHQSSKSTPPGRWVQGRVRGRRKPHLLLEGRKEQSRSLVEDLADVYDLLHARELPTGMANPRPGRDQVTHKAYSPKLVSMITVWRSALDTPGPTTVSVMGRLLVLKELNGSGT